jgi:hypothetical protein
MKMVAHHLLRLFKVHTKRTVALLSHSMQASSVQFQNVMPPA